MESIEPQALAAQTMQMILDNPDHHDQEAIWHEITDCTYNNTPCGFIHCWGGFTDAILDGLTTHSHSFTPYNNNTGEQCGFIYGRLMVAYGFTERVLNVFSSSDNGVEDLVKYTDVFTKPIESIDLEDLDSNTYLILVSRPDITFKIASFLVDQCSTWKNDRRQEQYDREAAAGRYRPLIVSRGKHEDHLTTKYLKEAIANNSRALAVTPELRSLLVFER